jgi:hypothetical protein
MMKSSMKIHPWFQPLRNVFLLFVAAAGLSQAHAQATRTWVSGVGDDANPGSRTAPCKTYAGAISKTAAGGEISTLDPGGFGAVTITKAITIDGDGTLAGILATGSNGIIINAGVNDVVVIRNVSIKNSGGGVSSPSGLVAIKILQAGAVHIENCTLDAGTDTGISFQPSNSGAKLYITNTTILNFAGPGVRVAPGSAAQVYIADSNIQQCQSGILVDQGGKVMAKHSNFVGSSGDGIATQGTGAAFLEGCAVNGNGGDGVDAGNGLGGGSPVINMSDTCVFNNGGKGIAFNGNGKVNTFKNCSVYGNGNDGNPSTTINQK